MNSGTIGGLVAALVYLNEREKQKQQSPQPQVKYHSILLWFFFGWIVLWLPCIYYFLSDKHRFKLL